MNKPTKNARDTTLIKYAKTIKLDGKRQCDPISYLRGWHNVKRKGEKK